MDEQRLETSEEPARSRYGRWAVVQSVVLQVMLISLPLSMVLWIIERWQGITDQAEIFKLGLVAGSAALLAACWGVMVHRRLWSMPARSLIQAIQDAQQGEMAIEELSRISGGIEPLVKAVQELLRVQKEHRAKQAELEVEMRGRIANRTDALERKIGSLQNQAMRDVLTGLWNRRSMMQEVPRLMEAFQSEGTDACVLMIDVDHFKALNDTRGHAAGDQLLKEIGQIIRSTIRETDMAFRCGGDEFVILLSGGSLSSTNELSKRLESLVEVLVRPLRLAMPPKLSIGACCLSELGGDVTPEAWLEMADKRLYDVKAARKGLRAGNGVGVKKSA